jgi:hypothetical protein
MGGDMEDETEEEVEGRRCEEEEEVGEKELAVAERDCDARDIREW